MLQDVSDLKTIQTFAHEENEQILSMVWRAAALNNTYHIHNTCATNTRQILGKYIAQQTGWIGLESLQQC